MVKYALDTNQKRDIVLLFSNKTASEIVYSETFDEAAKKFGMKTIYTLTDKTQLPADWAGSVGRIDAAMIEKEIPDYRQRLFYISGPNALVTANERLLRSMGVSRSHIKTDFFPGFA